MENIEKGMFELTSNSILTKVIFAYNAEDKSKKVRQVLIFEAWGRRGEWTGNFNFQITTDSYTTIYTELGLEYFGEVYKLLKEDGVDENVLNTLESIVCSYLPPEAMEEAEREECPEQEEEAEEEEEVTERSPMPTEPTKSIESSKGRILRVKKHE